jgi:hypothetical protein
VSHLIKNNKIFFKNKIKFFFFFDMALRVVRSPQRAMRVAKVDLGRWGWLTPVAPMAHGGGSAPLRPNYGPWDGWATPKGHTKKQHKYYIYYFVFLKKYFIIF